MSSTNDIYHHLFVPIQPKSILKKSPSPRFLDSSINFEKDYYSNTLLSSTCNSDNSKTSKNQSIKMDNSNLPSVETPLTKLIMTSNENSCQYEIDRQLVRSIPPRADSSSDDEPSQQQQRIKIKPKKTYYRSFAPNGTMSSSPSSSDNNDERKAKLSVVSSKTTSIRSNKHRQKDMQLDEFIRKYQQQGGIHLPIKTNSINNDYPSSQSVHKVSINDDTISLLDSINTITLSSNSLSPLQLLFNVVRRNQIDRRIKIDQIRHYVEEQIGISSFLTIYKLIKSSQIPIDIQQKPFCYYANLIPYLCCLIMLESEQQKQKIIT